MPGWDDEYVSRFESLHTWFALPHVPPKGDLLEFGCGAGNLTLPLAKHGFRVTGVDIAPHAITWARERVDGCGYEIDLWTRDLLDLGAAPAARFDIVFDSHCFHCIIGADREQFLSVARHLLRPGGMLHIETMCGDVKSERIRKTQDPVSRNLMTGKFATRYVGDAQHITQEVQLAGFQVVYQQIVPSETTPDLLILDAIR